MNFTKMFPAPALKSWPPTVPPATSVPSACAAPLNNARAAPTSAPRPSTRVNLIPSPVCSRLANHEPTLRIEPAVRRAPQGAHSADAEQRRCGDDGQCEDDGLPGGHGHCRLQLHVRLRVDRQTRDDERH